MIELKNYICCMKKLSILLQAEMPKDWLEAMKVELDKYFDDKTFQQACCRLVAQVETYGKLPTIKQFLEFSPVKGVDVNLEKKQDFLNKVSNYLQLDYVSNYDREKFNNLTELEYLSLQSIGGLSELYARVHSFEYPASVSKIIQNLSDAYDSNFSVEKSKTASQNQIFLTRGESIPDEYLDNWSKGVSGLIEVFNED